MSKKVSYIITDQNITVNYDGQTHIVKRSDVLAKRLIEAIKNNKLDVIPSLVSTAKHIETYSKGAFVVKNGRIQINGNPAPQVLSDKIVRFANDGLPFKPLLKFAENLQKNPSYRAVNELFQFLEKNDHPITENGNFIAYKRVRSNFTDIHSGKFDNSVGNVLEVPRNQVDEDPERTCSYGLHVANWHYAHTQFASHDADHDIMLEVEVNPSDVVAIPNDYNQSKMRVSKYKVLGVITQPYEGEPLRIVDADNFDSSETDEIDEAKYDGDLDDNAIDDNMIGHYCRFCGEPACFSEYEDECNDFYYDTKKSSSDEDNDPYPYEDELEDE